MKRVAIVQARMGSTRLPGKVLADIAGRPMLARVIDRLRSCPDLDEVVLATTVNAEDDVLLSVAEGAGARWYRGSANDVLARYVGAAFDARADVVVRITADCPLIDSDVVSRVVRALETAGPSDYAANILKRSFPRGLDTEALHVDCLRRIDRLAMSSRAREHVTYYAYAERPDLFVIRSVTDPVDNSDLRWTVDTVADLALVRRLYADLDLSNGPQPYAGVVAYTRSHPSVEGINARVEQRPP